MWIKTYSKTYQDVDVDAVWQMWSDIDNWPKWNPGIEYCQLNGPFTKGSFLDLKPKGAPLAQLELIEVENGKKFTDCSRFPGAKMYGLHEMEKTPDGIKLTTTMTVEGWLSYLWIFLVAKKIVAKIPGQTDNLVELARQLK